MQGNLTMEWDSACKKKTIVPFVSTLMSLESTLLSKISQSLKDQHCIPPLWGGTYNSETHRDDAWSCGSQESRHSTGVLVSHGTVSAMQNKLVLEMHCAACNH